MSKKKKNEITIRSSAAEYLTFVAATGDDEKSVEMRYEDENIWLTQKMMAELYNVDVRTINEHIQRIFTDLELSEESTIRNFRIVHLIMTRIQKPPGRFSSWFRIKCIGQFTGIHEKNCEKKPDHYR